MLAQQIIFGLFHYELWYSYNHALPSPHQKSCPYIASHQSSQITLNYHPYNATEYPLSCRYKKTVNWEEKATPS